MSSASGLSPPLAERLLEHGEIELFTKPGCGWAERNFAALIEKKIAFRVVMSCEADGRSTAEFLAVSPYGKTPALRLGADSVWESSIINDYLDDLIPDPPLRPRSAGRRAEAVDLSLRRTADPGAQRARPLRSNG